MSFIAPKYNFNAEDLIKKGRTTKAKVDEIRKWLIEHPNIPKLSDEQIVLFLLSCNNVIEDTITTIKAYYKHRSNSPEFFTNRDAHTDQFLQTFNVAEMAVFPKHTPDNYAIIFSHLRDTSYYNFHAEQQVKQLFMCLDIALHTNPPDGLVVIFDMKGVGLLHLTRLKLGIIKKFFSYLQEALPTQLKQIHILNCTYIFDKILMLCKPFMKKELMDLFVTHPASMDFSEFHQKFIPAECLPSDFEGKLASVKQMNDSLLVNFQGLKTYFEMEEKQTELYRKV